MVGRLGRLGKHLTIAVEDVWVKGLPHDTTIIRWSATDEIPDGAPAARPSIIFPELAEIQVMRLLALSDIHGQIAAVQRLRSQEGNDFDVVVVAGDIGSEAAPEVFAILSSFGCPVLYVYGNHDHALEYDRTFGDNTRHLHLRAVPVGDWVFVGYSGLPTHWGLNPIVQQLRAEVDSRHRDLIAQLGELEAAEGPQIAEAEAACADAIAALDAKTKDRRRRTYRDKADRIYGKKHDAIGRIRGAVRALRESQAWHIYEAERWNASTQALALNRQALAAVVRRVNPSRCIVMTHERQTNTSADLAGVPLFLFGHIHGFKNTVFKGTRFINVSALDAFVTMLPAGLENPTFRDMRNVDLGTYVVIEIDRAGAIAAQPRRFMELPEGWSRVPQRQDRSIQRFGPGLD